MSHAAPNQTAIGEFTIEPGEAVECCVGVYEACLPQPYLIVEFQPHEAGGIKCSLVRIDGHGDYTLMYYFENEGNATYVVTVHARWPEES